MKHTIIHSQTGDKIYVDPDIPILAVNNLEMQNLDIRDIELFCLIVDAKPNTVKYSDIEEKLLKKYGIVCDTADPTFYIRKKKHCILKSIRETRKYPPFPSLIETIRGVGYRLEKNWHKETAHASFKTIIPGGINDIIKQLGQAVEDAILLQESIPLHDVEIGDDIIIVLNTDGFSRQIYILQHKYLELSSKLLQALNLTPVENKYVLVESVLRLLRSYFSMSRQGTKISHKEWRTMFQDEFRHHFRYLIMLIQS